MKKAFSLKQSLETLFFFCNEEIKSKEIQDKNVLSFTKFVLGVFGLGGFVQKVFIWGFMSGGGFPDTVKNI